MRRLLAAVPFLFLALAVGVGGWIAWDTVTSVREANQPEAAASTTSMAPTTTASTTTASTTSTLTTTTTVPTSALDGIVLYTVDNCYLCRFLELRLGRLAGEVPLWLRPPEEGVSQVPTVVVQFGGQVMGRWEGQVAVNSAEAIAAFAGERWPEWTGTATTGPVEVVCGIENPEWVFTYGTEDPAPLGLLKVGNSIEMNFDVAQVDGILTDLYLADYETVDGETIDMWYAEFCFRDQPRLTGTFVVGTSDQTVGVVSVSGDLLPFDPVLEGQDMGWSIRLIGVDELASRMRIGRQYAFELFLSSREGTLPERIEELLRYNRGLLAAMQEGGEAPEGFGWLQVAFYALRGRL